MRIFGYGLKKVVAVRIPSVVDHVRKSANRVEKLVSGVEKFETGEIFGYVYTKVGFLDPFCHRTARNNKVMPIVSKRHAESKECLKSGRKLYILGDL